MSNHYQSLPGGDLFIIDKKGLAGFYIDIVFMYDTSYTFDEAHLLEHLLLFPNRHLTNGSMTLEEETKGLGYIDGFTGGTFIDISTKINKVHACEMVKVIMKVVNSPLIIDEPRTKNECKILHIENTYQDQRLVDIQKIEKYYKNSHHRDVDWSIQHMRQVHQNIILKNRPIIVIHTDLDSKPVDKAIQVVKENLTSTMKERRQKNFFQYDGSYHPSIQQFQASNSPKKVSIFFSLPFATPKQRAMNRLLQELLGYYLFDISRYSELCDYQPIRVHRAMSYARQIGVSFFSKMSTQAIQALLLRFFSKQKTDFERDRQKVYNEAIIWTDDTIHSYYFIIQEFLFTDSYVSVNEIAEQIKSVSFEEFMEYYHSIVLPSLTLEREDWKV